ncbi:MAG: DUF4382 domain-containing protein, partial [bacterium]|nr:DUF4382 domain-containing protein [bacterium]
MRIRPLFFLVLVFFVACSGLNSNLNNNDVGGDKGGVIDPSLSGSGITAPSAEDIAASQPITGQIRVTMHDAPIEDKKVSHVYITIREVQIGSEEKGWIVLNSTPQEYDLLTLVNDVTAALGGATIAAGTYDQIRLILSEENRVIAEGIEQKLKTPSGQQTGIKLDGPFTVGSGEIVSVELDFDAQESIHWNSGQGFMLKPVIKILSVVSADGLFGARQISADTGGVVALPDGAMIQIPPGA